jgi:hypothetical protein
MSSGVDKIDRVVSLKSEKNAETKDLLRLNLHPDLEVTRIRIAQWNRDYWPDAMYFVLIDLNRQPKRTQQQYMWLRNKYRQHVVDICDSGELGIDFCEFYFQKPVRLWDCQLFIAGTYSSAQTEKFENAALHVYGSITDPLTLVKTKVVWEFDIT